MFKKIKSSQLLNPLYWTFRHYIFAVCILLGANVLGPRGIIQLTLLHQEKERLALDIEKTLANNKQLNRQITLFKTSKTIREKAIREYTGSLKENEIFVEFRD